MRIAAWIALIVSLSIGGLYIGEAVSGWASEMRLVAADGQKPTLSPEQWIEYYQLGSDLLYRQLLAANARIEELEAKTKSLRLETEARAALDASLAFRDRLMGDSGCRIVEADASIVCPEASDGKTKEHLKRTKAQGGETEKLAQPLQ